MFEAAASLSLTGEVEVTSDGDSIARLTAFKTATGVRRIQAYASHTDVIGEADNLVYSFPSQMNVSAVSPSGQVIYLHSGSAGHLSLDGGETWSGVESPQTVVGDVVALDSGKVLVAHSSGSVKIWSVGAWSAVAVDSGLPDESFGRLMRDTGGTVYVATQGSNRFYKSTDAGQSWVLDPVINVTEYIYGYFFHAGKMYLNTREAIFLWNGTEKVAVTKVNYPVDNWDSDPYLSHEFGYVVTSHGFVASVTNTVVDIDADSVQTDYSYYSVTP